MHTQGKAFHLVLLILSDYFSRISKVKSDFTEWKRFRGANYFGNAADYAYGQKESEPGTVEDLDTEYQRMEDDDSDRPPVDFYINEANLDTSNGRSGKYIELYLVDFEPAITSYRRKFAGFHLLLLRGSPLEIVMSITLSDFVTKFEGVYLVVGDSTVPNLNININEVKLSKSFVGTFPDMDDCPFAFIICYSKDLFFQDLITMKKEGLSFSSISLSDNEQLQRAIFKTSMDAVVVGRKAPTNQCDFFSSFFPDIMMSPITKYILRDWDSHNTPTTDLTINYCCEERTPFSPSCFKLGSESPGVANDCSKRRFILEFEISAMSIDFNSPSSVNKDIEGCSPDFPGLSASKYAKVQESDFSAAVRRVVSTPHCENLNYVEGELGLANLQYFPDASTTEMPDNQIRKYVENFDDLSFKKCKQYFSNYLEVLTPQFKSWVQVSSQSNCVIKCRVCQTYFADGWRVDKKTRDGLQTKGTLSTDPSVNQRAIRNHLKSKIHIEASHYYGKLQNAASRAEQLEIESAQEQFELELFRPTMNEVQLGYAELRARSSFRSHKLFMNAVSSMGLNVGTKHRHDKALKQITNVLSESFHKRLLQYLVKNNKWFSIICDGTCNRQIPFLVCLFQTLENNRPMVFLWRLLTLTEGEVGENMVRDIQSKIEEDSETVTGFKEYFKSKVVASVSDGASNMVGTKNSFYTHLRDFAGRPLVLVKCLPHRLQRAVIHAINFPTDQPSAKVPERNRQRYFKEFSRINNQVYTFYMSRGSKRFQNLVELGQELDIPTYRINYFFDIRWAASHKRCMETLFKNYDVIRADLDRITSDPLFDDSSKSKAVELKGHFSDKAFPVVVSEFVDLLTVIQKMSERFQQKGGIMIGNVEIIKEGFDKLGRLAHHPGAFVTEFLSKCTCPGVCTKGKCTLQQYDQCSQINREGNQVLRSRTDGIHTINLSTLRFTLYQNMQQQLEAYFEFDKMEVFEVFNHKYFKKSCEVGESISCAAISDCYRTLPSISTRNSVRSPDQKIEYICTYYHIQDCSALINQWKALLLQFVRESSSASQSMDPVDFWAHQLNRKDIAMGVLVRDVMERIFATAFTSADAERAFSLVSSIKTPDRSSLSAETLESLVRIQFNGPDSLSKSSLLEYTKDYIRVASRVDDSSQVGGRPLKSTEHQKYTSKSGIF